MEEHEIFDLLMGGWIRKIDHRHERHGAMSYSVEIGDEYGDLSGECYGETIEQAYNGAIDQMWDVLAELNREEHHGSETAAERNPSLGY